MKPHVYSFEGMIPVSECEIGKYLRVRKKKENYYPVVRKDGVRVGIYPLHELNLLWGKGLYYGAVAKTTLRLLVLNVPVGRFHRELAQITGVPVPTRAQQRRYSRRLMYKYCARCGKEKDRDEFPDAPAWLADFLGCGAVCRSCVADERRRNAASNEEIRRIREAYAGGQHSLEEWAALLARSAHRCLRCGSTTDLTKDHVVPLARGGTHDIANIQPLCRRCNSWKNDRTIDFRDHSLTQDSRLLRFS